MPSWEGIVRAKSEIFFYGLISFLIGIVVSNFFTINNFLLFCLLLLSALGLIFYLLFKNQVAPSSGRRLTVLALLIWLACFLLGLWRYQISLPDYNNQQAVYYYNGQSIAVSGKITALDKSLTSQKLTIQTEFLYPQPSALPDEHKIITGRVLLATPLYPEFNYGDKIKFFCRLKKPETIDNFDYARYLSRYGIYSLCYSDQIKILEPSRLSFMGTVMAVKRKLSDSLNRSVSEPTAAILNGIVLGDARNIPDELKQEMSALGLTHIIAVSGSHLAVIAALLVSLCMLLGLSRLQAFWPATIGITFYVILVGAPASAIRSAIMGIMLLYAQKIGRLNYSRNALTFAAALMLLINPKLLLIDVGFQLSFAAVMGLIYLYPWLESKTEKFPNPWQLKEIFLLTLSAQIFTLPLTAYYFGKISPVSLLANLLILPIIPLLMIWGFFNALVGLFSVTLGQIVGYFSWLLVAYWLTVADLLSKIPFSTINF